MTFTKRLHPGIMAGEITETVRFWHKPRAKVGSRYAVGTGAVEVTRIRQIELADITPALARRSGFEGLVDMLKVRQARLGREHLPDRFRSTTTRGSKKSRCQPLAVGGDFAFVADIQLAPPPLTPPRKGEGNLIAHRPSDISVICRNYSPST